MYAEVIVNHQFSKLKETLTYKVPEEMEIKRGDLVMVPFGKNTKSGIILNLKKESPTFDTKYISETLSPNIFLHEWHIKLGQHISEYYFCSLYESLKLFLPKSIWKKNPTKSRSKAPTPVKKKEFHALTEDQKKIVDSIINEKIPLSLIHGVTGSGKTEVYKNLIQYAVDSDQQALLLVPEISLTPQFVKYFKGNFENLALVHSKISEGEKARQWKGIHNGEISLVIGSRSALFSPFKNLGVVIMDEEHEWTYKQEQAPRYNTRDVLFEINKLTNTQIIFGSATPSIEIMQMARSEKIHLFELNERVLKTEMPKIEIVDMREELKKQNFTMFSELLLEKIREKLDRKEQILLFLNRRGSASATVCRDCGEASVCNNCESKLTYHVSKFKHSTLICHHCGFITKTPDFCPKCQSHRIKHFGLGTEKVESELKKLFPQARIARADRDTMSMKDSFEELHKNLNAEEIDILIGTQMIAKGLDIANISLVGVIMADTSFHIPDFRASERSFQLLSQVGGRAGRREKQGEVIIQTYNPNHCVLEAVKNHNYSTFYEQEISAREAAQLPPFSKIIKLIFADENKKLCAEKADLLLKKLADENHQTFAAPALMPKMNKKFYWHVFVQGKTPESVIKKIDQELLKGWRIDVDPVQTV